MFKISKFITPIPKYVVCSQQNVSYTQEACRFKKQAVKHHANDGTGNHSHQANQYCVKSECNTKKCTILCDTLKDSEIKGHNTHKPPIGRFVRFISGVDVNGDPKTEYFVPSNTSNKMTAQEKQSYNTQIKPDIKMETYIKQHQDKYE